MGQIVELLPAALAWLSLAAAILFGAAVAASCGFYRREPEDGALLPMTVIRPLRGAEAGLEADLRSVIEADREGVLQVLFAVESAEDPAHAVAERVVRSRPGRDIRIVITGPSGARMGKMHNMIEALKAARHEIVVFSDSDVRPDRGVLAATSKAFAEGADAAAALPDATGDLAPADALVGICFNHYFMLPAALLYRLGLITTMAGGWLACRKSFLARIGGLESLENCAADDYAISIAAARLGAKAVLLPRFARSHERGGSPLELVRHLLKWARIVRFCAPFAYLLIPFFSPVSTAFAALAAAWILGTPAGGWAALLLAVCAWRGLLAWIQDRRTAASFFPLWIYFCLPLADLASVLFWLCGFLSDKIAWRGKTYRLRYGGRLEVISA